VIDKERDIGGRERDKRGEGGREGGEEGGRDRRGGRLT